MISTYAELQDAVKAWMLRSSTDLVVTTAQVKNYISLCEAEMNRELRVRELEDTEDMSTVADQNYITLPTDFRKVKNFEFDSAPYDLEFLSTKSELRRKWGTESGRPRSFTIFGDRIYLSPTPDAIYTLDFDYYKKVPALTDVTMTTNDILTNYPDVYLYGALRHGYMQIKDSKNKAEAESNYVAMIDRIKQSDIESRMPAHLRMRTQKRLA